MANATDLISRSFSGDQRISIDFSASQLRNAYQALMGVPSECRKQMLAILEENHAEWKHELPDEAAFNFKKLEDRKKWAVETMGILAAHAAISGVPVNP